MISGLMLCLCQQRNSGDKFLRQHGINAPLDKRVTIGPAAGIGCQYSK